MSKNKAIVLMTDFGLEDPYVGVMKGVIKSIDPDVSIIDLTHSIPSYDIRRAALVLFVSYKYFPKNTIFVCVVDPGVGTDRKALLIKTRNYYFIGPDNGCLYPAASEDGIDAIYDISRSSYRLREVSMTFHGRDIFAPVAAWLSRGIPPHLLGRKISVEDIVKLVFPKPVIDRECIDANILYIDKFGNIMTNIPKNIVFKQNISYGSKLSIHMLKNGDKILSPYKCVFERSFGYVNEGEIVCYINSWGYLEIGVNKGSAAVKLGVAVDDKIRVCKSVD